ncbi:Dipeptidyl-peptidase 5 [Pseudidiomarina piscicola]|uniref:Dipeptidyl-peptidase 5 n=1 Tax=Pseudidiomarina piscicola TaxID=2614830 RepID=A0A6S6WLV1_9GAMM|nr:S9 family peptidase [Pseudidiomarina piscicola]CAB0150715.1 Dipeptidyl-peptidase 5 [Pseudidiomarina piscicola]VZT40221.1 Dipeptidyl-peptidase 5 [Pseudomonas aeruginosa]
MTNKLSPTAISLCLVSALLLAPTVAQEQPALTKTLQAEDVFALEHANSVQISPDGNYIAYVRNSFDIMTDNTRRGLWLVDTATGQHTPLFADKHSYGNPTWSPDGKRLAFTSNRSGRNQIHVFWVEEQRVAPVTEVPKSPSQMAWSRDGEHLAFMMAVEEPKSDFAKSVHTPKKPSKAKWGDSPIIVERTLYQRDGRGVTKSAYNQVFVVPSEGGSARQITDGPFQHRGPLVWADNDQQIVFSANRNKDWEYQSRESDLWAVKLADNSLHQLTDLPGDEYSATLSPNGQQLAFIHGENTPVPYRNGTLHKLDWDTGALAAIKTNFDRSLGSPKWMDNQRLTVQYNDRGLTKVAEVNLNGELTERVSSLGGTYVSRPYTSGMYSLAPQTGAIAFTHATAYDLANVAVEVNGEVQQYTDLNSDVLGYRDLGEVKEINYTSSFDGTEIQGWYILPPGYEAGKTYPTLVEIHGGPHAAYGPVFGIEHQRYAAEGYVVLYVNYRGSTSYGAEFANLLDGFYASERDFADHMSGLDKLIEMGIADSDNLFIAGGSAGGIATAYAVGLTDRFNAAAATNPVINWVSKTLTADSSIGQIQNQFPAMPWEDLAHYWKRSPLSLVGNVTTPTLLFTGELDRRTPMAETEQFYQALQLQNVDSVMVRVPGAYHGVTAKPSRIVAKVEHALAWFKRYRKE